MFLNWSPASYTLSYFNSFKKGKKCLWTKLFQNQPPGYSQTYIKYAYSFCASIDNTYQNTKNSNPNLGVSQK